MHFHTLFLSLLLGSSSAMTMHKPTFLDIRSPTLDELTASSLVRMSGGLSGFQAEAIVNQAWQCYSLSDIQMNQGALPPPSPGLNLYHIAIGRGTQNYSCPTNDSDAVPQTYGATATLFNITCAMGYANGSAKVASAFSDIIKAPSPDPNSPALIEATTRVAAFQSGHHYFTNDNKTATFNLHSVNADYGITYSNKIATVPAPAGSLTGSDGSKAVPWLKLKVINPAIQTPQLFIETADSQSNVQEIYRLNTAGGAAPATCGNLRGNFTQEYAAEYWFWH